MITASLSMGGWSLCCASLVFRVRGRVRVLRLGFCVRVRVSVMGSVSYLNENFVVYILLLSAPAIHRQSSMITCIPGHTKWYPCVNAISTITLYTQIYFHSELQSAIWIALATSTALPTDAENISCAKFHIPSWHYIAHGSENLKIGPE